MWAIPEGLTRGEWMAMLVAWPVVTGAFWLLAQGMARQQALPVGVVVGVGLVAPTVCMGFVAAVMHSMYVDQGGRGALAEVDRAAGVLRLPRTGVELKLGEVVRVREIIGFAENAGRKMKVRQIVVEWGEDGQARRQVVASVQSMGLRRQAGLGQEIAEELGRPLVVERVSRWTKPTPRWPG